jgi:cellulose synthase/poly-beta-1,6-N-acetylglucosamine synthase-like glycosyltransferase
MEIIAWISGIALLLASLSYAGLIFLFTLGWRKLESHGQKSAGAGPAPRVSVIVAARNEAGNIANLLNDLAAQDYPAELTEIILVDDNSTDGTSGVIHDYLSRSILSHFKLISRRSGDGSKKSALSQAVGSASGQVILVTDADCSVKNNWISVMAGYFRDPNTMMVAGPVALAPVSGIVDRFQALEFLGLVASGAGAAGSGQPFLCNGACLAYRKKAFKEVGGYSGNEKFRSGDDVFLLHKIKKIYGRRAIAFALSSGALVRTAPAGGCMAFLRQRARWASKSTGYKDVLSMLTAVTVFLLSLTLTGLFLAGFFYPPAFLLYLGLILCKTAVDYPLMREILEFTGNRGLIKWLAPFEAVYPFYVVIAGILSVFWRRHW